MIATEGVLINCIGKLAFTVKEMMARFILMKQPKEPVDPLLCGVR